MYDIVHLVWLYKSAWFSSSTGVGMIHAGWKQKAEKRKEKCGRYERRGKTMRAAISEHVAA
tara:strand:+ start:790 stop:972 length:183 start_codon:yes stop_codon:yes gene_type:complete